MPSRLQITSGDFNEEDINWSSDGSRIFFTSTRVAEAYYEDDDANLYAVPAAGGEIVTIADIKGVIRSIAPSPDGKSIAFVGWSSDTTRSYDEPDLFVTSTAPNSTPRNLTATFDGDILGGLATDQHPPRANRPARLQWSSDSRTISATAAVKGASNLLRVDAANGRITPWTRASHEVVSYARAGTATVALISIPTMITDLFAVDD